MPAWDKNINHSIVSLKNEFVVFVANIKMDYSVWHRLKKRLKFPTENRMREFKNRRFYYKVHDENYNEKFNKNFQETQRVS